MWKQALSSGILTSDPDGFRPTPSRGLQTSGKRFAMADRGVDTSSGSGETVHRMEMQAELGLAYPESQKQVDIPLVILISTGVHDGR